MFATKFFNFFMQMCFTLFLRKYLFDFVTTFFYWQLNFIVWLHSIIFFAVLVLYYESIFVFALSDRTNNFYCIAFVICKLKVFFKFAGLSHFRCFWLLLNSIFIDWCLLSSWTWARLVCCRTAACFV